MNVILLETEKAGTAVKSGLGCPWALALKLQKKEAIFSLDGQLIARVQGQQRDVLARGVGHLVYCSCGIPPGPRQGCGEVLTVGLGRDVCVRELLISITSHQRNAN